MKRITIFIIAVLLSSLTMAQTVLFNNHRSCYYIVVPQQPTPVEMHAAEELQHYIELCSGAKLPIENENEILLVNLLFLLVVLVGPMPNRCATKSCKMMVIC